MEASTGQRKGPFRAQMRGLEDMGLTQYWRGVEIWGALGTGSVSLWPSALSATFLPPTHSLLPPIKHHLGLLAAQTINGCNFNLKLTMVLSVDIMDKCKIQPISSESRSSVNTKYWL